MKKPINLGDSSKFVSYKTNGITNCLDLCKMILNNYEKKDRKEIDSTINFSTVKCYVTIKFYKVTEFYMDISPILESLDEEDNFKFNKVIIGINNITYDDIIIKGLKVMDTASCALCKQNSIPIVVFDFAAKGSINKILKGEKIGTYVGG